MQKIYETVVTKLGPLVDAFYGEKMVILFKDNAPDELADYCVLHNLNDLMDKILAGDILKIDNVEYKITSVGGEVYKNLKDLGHICIRFDGSASAELPGSLYVEDKEIKEFNVKTRIEIVR